MTQGHVMTDELSLARGIARQLAETSGAPAALLAGSIAEGFGNTTSDIDIYLIGPQLTAAREQLAAGYRRVDVHSLAPADIDAVIGLVAAATLPSDGSAPVFPDRHLALLARLSSAEVINGAEIVEAQRQRLKETRARLRRLVIFKWLTAAHAELEDLRGLRGAGDSDAATLTARSALLAAGKAVAAAGDELYLGHKWVWRQLCRSAPPAFPLSTFSRMLRVDLVDEVPGWGFADCADLVQTCLAAACTLGWQGAGLGAWPSWTLESPIRPGGLARAPGFYPRAFDDAVVLTQPTARRVRLRPEVALVWALCDGSAVDAIVNRAAALRDTASVYQDLDPDRCRHIVARLVDAGLLMTG